MATQCNATELIPARQNPPKDGYGPRGAPDCYYTSRVLDSTARYVKFVKKLRALEDEQRKGQANTLKELKDKQINEFFIRCDRRSLINNVARRVDLCMASYQEDLRMKRERLLTLLSEEEEMNIHKFVEQAQAGAEALWQDKKDRLAYLLAKRQKEHEEKYKDIPISKCVHVHPCIVKMHAREVQEAQLYQMKENQARKMAEREFDNMWHDVALKESEALAARMELDAIERFRRDHECLKYGEEQVRLNHERRLREQEALKQETLRMRAINEEQQRQEDEENRKRQEKRFEMGRERKQMLKERQATLNKKHGEEKLLADTWDSLAGMGLADEMAKKQLIIQKRRELDVCNQKMQKIKQDKAAMEAADNVVLAEDAQRLQDQDDEKRCAAKRKSKKAREDCHADIIAQIQDNAATRQRKVNDNADYNEYQSQLAKQLDQLVAHRELTEAQARKLYEKNLLQQIDYNKLLKERAKEEELAQREKYKLATADYHHGILKIMNRALFCDEIHPFKKPLLAGLKLQEKCPCSKPDYCAVPVLGPKHNPGTSTVTAPNTKPGASSSK